MWRHGTIHTDKPKVLEDPVKGRRLGCMSYYGPRKNGTWPPPPGGHPTPQLLDLPEAMLVINAARRSYTT